MMGARRQCALLVAPPQAPQFFIEPDDADNARNNRDRRHEAGGCSPVRPIGVGERGERAGYQ